MSQGTIVSVRTGRVAEHPRPGWDHAPGATWRSAYRKDEVPGAVRVTTLGLEGDEQAHRDVHGGPHMAVLVYAAAHYALWREEPGLGAMAPGAFAENLAVDGLDESTVCIGDVFQAADVVFEVAQPRGPCAAIARIWDQPGLVQRVTDTARTGWYLRVLKEGTIARGAVLARTARPDPEWTVERVFRMHVDPAADRAAMRELAECAALSPRWRQRFADGAAARD